MRVLLANRYVGLLAVTLVSFVVATDIHSSARADFRADTFKAMDSDSADHSCQVVLRSASLKRDPASGHPVIETDSTGQNWYSFESTVDAATAPLSSGTAVYLLYRASGDERWHTAPGVTVEGAPQGMRRLAFRLSHSTLMAPSQTTSLPDDKTALKIIPYLQTSDGRRIFDHNSTSDDSESQELSSANEWRYDGDSQLCPSAGRGTATLRFLSNWNIEQRGLLHPGQSLFVEYDLTRLPQCQASSYNGLPSWQTEAMIRFYPSGEEISATLNSLQNGKMMPTPARFEIPNTATHAHLWFKTRGRNCEQSWDSNYGRNYEFNLEPNVASSPSWAGEWKAVSSNSSCLVAARINPLPEAATVSESELRGCRSIEAEVLIPGLTTSVDAAPHAVQAQVQWSLDGISQQTTWLSYVGRSGQNYRYQWSLPIEFLKQRPWRRLDYSFHFSTDGLYWLSAGRASSHKNGIVEPRTLEYRAHR
jgi:hypothetical protein